MTKYHGSPKLQKKALDRILAFKEGDFIFIQDMNDLFARNVPTQLILDVLDNIRRSPAKFLLMTKNPELK